MWSSLWLLRPPLRLPRQPEPKAVDVRPFLLHRSSACWLRFSCGAGSEERINQFNKGGPASFGPLIFSFTLFYFRSFTRVSWVGHVLVLVPCQVHFRLNLSHWLPRHDNKRAGTGMRVLGCRLRHVVGINFGVEGILKRIGNDGHAPVTNIEMAATIVK